MKKRISRSKYFLSLMAAFVSCATTLQAQTGIVPLAGQSAPNTASGSLALVTGNGIDYHGGPVMVNSQNVYFIWYGNWSGNSALSILPAFITGLSGSAYFNIDTTYADGGGQNVANNPSMNGQVFDNYSQGTVLSDQGLQAVVSRQLQAGALPTDSNGIYFVLTSSDVTQSGSLGQFCVNFCGFHNHASLNGADIKYSFVGDIARCPQACAASNIGPGPNGNVGADAMANVISHELSETVTDPDLNAWFDSSGQEVGDKCNFNFGPEFTAPNGAPANVTLRERNFLVQQIWVNSSGGFCGLSFGNSLPVSPLSTFTTTSGEQHWAFIGTNDHVYNLYWSPSTGKYVVGDASAASGAPAAVSGALSTFTTTSGEQHWGFIGTNGHVYNLYWSPSTGKYVVADASAASGAPAAENGALSTFTTSSGEQHWAFIGTDSHIYNLYWSPSTGDYSVADASAASGAPAAESGALSTFTTSSGEQHWAFIGTDSHVYNLYWSPSTGKYVVADASAASGAPAAVGGAISTFTTTSGEQHWGFIGTDGHVYNLYWSPSTGKYVVADASAGSGAPEAASGALSTFTTASGEQHWGFIGTDGHVYNLYWSPSTGKYVVADASAGSGAPEAASGALSAFTTTSGEQHWAFLGTNGHVYNLYWSPSTGDYSVADASAASGAPPAE